MGGSASALDPVTGPPPVACPSLTSTDRRWGADAALDERVHQRVLATADGAPLDDPALAVLVRTEAPLLGPTEVAAAVARVRARIGGLGPLEPLLADPRVTDVLINGPGPVWVERAGRLRRTSVTVGPADIALLVERVVAPLGLRADRSTPVVDARLPDGSRVHIVLPPLAVDGPIVTIRRFTIAGLPLAAFCEAEVAALLVECIDAGRNMVVSGGTGAGKTTLLNALCAHVQAGERVVTVEDAAELRLPGDHVVRLETRPPAPDGITGVAVRELVRAALRMRPDRIVVGEVRGAEALDMIQAMSTGHAGCLSTCHANRRIETMASLGQREIPLAAVRSQMISAVDVVVHLDRRSGGRRQVTAVAEVVDGDGRSLAVRPVATEHGLISTCRRPARRVALDRPTAGGPGVPTPGSADAPTGGDGA